LTPTIKSLESPWFPYVQVTCDILLESFRWGLQIFFKPYLNRRSTHKIMGSKFIKVLTLGIWGLPLGSPRTKWHLGAGPMARHIVYYKGEGGDFPQVWVVVTFVSSCLLVVSMCIKVLQLRTNQLVIWFV